MCGVFGIIRGPDSRLNGEAVAGLLPTFFKLAEKRGREASGLAVYSEDQIEVYKRAGSPSSLLKSADYGAFVSRTITGRSRGGLGVIGHSRLVTVGPQGFSKNNQPVITEHSVGIHNGIVVNYREICARRNDVSMECDVDSEVIFRLVDANYKLMPSISAAVVNTFKEIEGAASIAFFHDSSRTLTVMTNTGSLYVGVNRESEVLVFASEPSFVQTTVAQNALNNLPGFFEIEKLQPGHGITVSLGSFAIDKISSDMNEPRENQFSEASTPLTIIDAPPSPKTLQRCTRCILPKSFPLIDFDEDGICKQCRDYEPRKLYGAEALQRLADQHRKNNGEADCVVTLSGGRDSSYGLHYVKKELGLNPIAMTYDWGMVTDLARRNQSRLCASLGVEHVIRSPDISIKRRNIRKNLEAWLKRPDLGVMLPLLTAGDKQFYHYPRQLRKEYNLDLVFFAAGADLERTVFKTAFCGISEDHHGQILGNFPLKDKFHLSLYFARQFLLNPRYFNSSLIDSLWAFFETYVVRDDFVYLFHYLPWDEKKIMAILREQYDWEIADDTTTTWRIGDGTAAFYNYVFVTVAGFSEHDTFRSNQVRAGLIDREEALRLATLDNQPRFEAMAEYARLVGFNLDEALIVINTMPKRY